MKRDEMVLLESRDGREYRAAIVEGRLHVYAFDRFEDDWHPDPESGVSLSAEGRAALHAFLAMASAYGLQPCTAFHDGQHCKNFGQFDGRCYFHRREGTL